jgi:hypothetical protein
MLYSSRFCGLGALILASALILAAQVSTARLEGFVTDPSGAVVAGVRVTAVNTRTRLAIGWQGGLRFGGRRPAAYAPGGVAGEAWRTLCEPVATCGRVRLATSVVLILGAYKLLGTG